MESREAVFTRLIDRDAALLRSAALRVLGNVCDADEAIQNALLAAWKKFDTFRSEAKLSSWIYRITVNSSYDLLRQRRREKVKHESYAADAAATADSGTDSGDRMEELMSAVAELPGLYREALTIGFLSGLSGEEAAAMLGCSVNTLYQRIHKAKLLLKDKFKGDAI